MFARHLCIASVVIGPVILGISLTPSPVLAQGCTTFVPPCEDQRPVVSISPAADTLSDSTVLITITFSDDYGLNWSSVSISPSGFTTTEQGQWYGSAGKVVTLNSGSGTTITASICDSNSQCDTATATYYYSPPAGPVSPSAATVDTTPHNGEYQDLSRCVAACFENVLTYSTPSYRSLDAERGVTLIYWPPRVRQRATVIVDAYGNWSTAPSQMSLKLKRGGRGSVSMACRAARRSCSSHRGTARRG